MLYGVPFPGPEILREYQLWPEQGEAAGVLAEGMHHLLIDALRGSERSLVLEVILEGHKPPYYKGFAWGFGRGRYLAYALSDRSIQFRKLTKAQQETFAELLKSLPGSDVDGSRDPGPVAFDSDVVFVWGKMKNTIAQGSKGSPILRHARPGEPESPRKSPWIRRAFDAIDDLGIEMYDAGYREWRDRQGL